MAYSSRPVKFMKIISLILDTGTIALAFRLKHEVKKAGVTFRDFLSTNKHVVFHLYERRNCCNCVGNFQHRGSILSKPQWEILFKATTKSCNKQRPCLCQYEPQTNVSEDDLDLTLLCSILQNTCSLPPAELEYVKNLREERNNLFHLKNVNIEEDIFQREFSSIQSTIESIVHPCGTDVFARVTEAIENLSKSQLNDNMCRHVLSLLYYIENSTGEKLSSICQDLEQLKIHLGVQPKDTHDGLDKQEECSSVQSENSRTYEFEEEVVNAVSNDTNSKDKTRKMHVRETKSGTETIHRAHAMIVGCAGAGKTTLFDRLLGFSHKSLQRSTGTVGLNIHTDVFEINPESFTLKVHPQDSLKEKKMLLSVLDFGGQCAYYACHQIYLQRRAFFIQVVDISKSFEEKMDPFLCEQDGTMFANYTYGDYFLYWLKWIHTYCDHNTPVIIVATHLDLVSDPQEMKSSFFQKIVDLLTPGSNLEHHISKERCFFTGLRRGFKTLFEPLTDLENCISAIACDEKWAENIPTEWAWYEDSIHRLLSCGVKIVKRNKSFHQKVFSESEDLMKFYNDIGVILYFNERLLRDIVILDVHWFASGFKYVITDQNHFKWLRMDDEHDWMYFNQTGYLKDSLLDNIKKRTYSRFEHKEVLLLYMERLGLLARGESHSDKQRVHYVPSMNKRSFDSKGKHIFETSQTKTTVLVYQFQFFPYFHYFRLVVALMSPEMPFSLLNDAGDYLYKDLAYFLYKGHIVALAATESSIQIQVLHRDDAVDNGTVIEIRNLIEKRLEEITGTFHGPCRYTVGYQCSYQEVYSHLPDCFVQERDILGRRTMSCPAHLSQNRHQIEEENIVHYWKERIHKSCS